MPATKSFRPRNESVIPSSNEESPANAGYSEEPRIRERSFASAQDDNRGYNRSSDYSRPERDVPTEEVNGYLDVMPDGHGFLRPKYIPSDRDVYISSSQIRRFNLRPGDFVEGAARQPKENERYFGLLQVDKVNGESS